MANDKSFQQRLEAFNSSPSKIPSGTKLICKNPTSTMTKDKSYIVRGHFLYFNRYGLSGNYYYQWDEFITIKNDNNYTIKVNLNNFYNELTFLTDGKRHLICIPYSIRNLHRMAYCLGIGRHWFHNQKRGFAHYDIPKNSIRTVELHCRIITTKELITIIKSSKNGNYGKI